MTKRKSRLQKFISKVLTIAIIFIASNLALSWIADWSAYREPVAVNKVEWNAIFEKMQKKEDILSSNDYFSSFLVVFLVVFFSATTFSSFLVSIKLSFPTFSLEQITKKHTKKVK